MRKFGGSAGEAIESRSRAVKGLGVAALATVVTLAACGGGDGTTGISGPSVLDANAISASANKLGAVISQPVLAVVAQRASLGSVSFDRGVPGLPRLLSQRLPQSLVSATRLAPELRGALAQTNTATPRVANGVTPLVIPDTLLGKTLVPNLFGQYVISASATGAPANGVRFVIADPNTGLVLGHADLTGAVNGATSTLTLDVVSSTGSTVLHDVETTTTSGTSGDGSDGFVGYATDGTNRIDYSEVEQTVNGRTTSVTTVTAPSANVAITDSAIVAGLKAGDVNVARLTVGSSTLRFSTNTVADTTAAGGYTSSDTTSVTANDAPFARIVVGPNGSASITNPSGGALSSGDQAALNAVEGVFLASAMVLVVPITIALWLSLAASGL